MVFRVSRWLSCLSLVLLGSSAAFAADLDVYRDFKLGASTPDVLARAGAIPRDLKTLHERPSLLQEFSWRPPYVSSREPANRDSVRGIVFSFIDNRLFKIAIAYDPSRTEGLTKNDMIGALTAVYGAPSPLPRQPANRAGYDSLDAGTAIAQWQRGDTTATLQHAAYGNDFSLLIVAVSLADRARQAQATAVIMDSREAPVREAARAKAQADAAKAEADKTRTTNKTTFQP
jgi:hypothetical protein